MTKRGLAALIITIVAGAVLVEPYLSLNPEQSRIEVSGSLPYTVLVVHIFTAAVALVLGPLQFLAGVRARRRLHRAAGRTYLLGGVLPAAVTAVPVALWSGRLLTQVSLSTAAMLWVVTAVLAYRSARSRDFAGHRAWMMRNYALTLLALTARALVPIFLLVQVASGGAGLSGTASSGAEPAALARDLIPVGQTAAWIINLIVAEILIRRFHRGAGSGRPRDRATSARSARSSGSGPADVRRGER
ncbi:DUF2306 domain-containing protein [Actinoplanes sp. TFC3]|uniref:DUF2306 domain-containing protein n=1 Tax=Actinoplanes sp. TFC3 TaxID=1710355 RepID=UPI00082F3EBE|nr:DUF2306 domain-containing protein [Actinoplanes sp. TFC3]